VLTFAISLKQADLLVGQLDPGAAPSIKESKMPDTHFLAIVIADNEIHGVGLEKL